MARILVVDDEPAMRQLLREELEEAGYEVLLAADGAEGLRLHRETRPDLVITDMIMPRRSGIELVLQLNRECPDVKIIAMSGVAGREFMDAGADVGVARSFVKPLDVNALLSAVRELTT